VEWVTLMARVLTADDNRELVALLGFALGCVGYNQIVAHDGRQALAMARSESPDLILLDVNMPDMSGFDILDGIRSICDTPVIIMSGRTSEEDQIEGFSRGADDYVIKPFSVPVLIRRMRALLRRCGQQEARAAAANPEGRAYLVASAEFFPDRNELIGANGKRHHLTPKEARILALLLRHKPLVLSSATLLERVWGYDAAENPVLVKTHVYHLRRKLRSATGGRDPIRTVPGVGYLLDD